MSWYYWLLIPASIWIIVLISPVVLNVQIKKRGKDERYDLGIHLLWGLINFDLDIPKLIFNKKKIEIEAEVERPHKEPMIDQKVNLSMELVLKVLSEIVEKRKSIIKRLSKFSKITRRIVRLEKFYWEIEYGVDDAALTGMLYGFLWQGISAFLAILGRAVSIRSRPKIKIYPEFNRYIFKTEMNCIFRLRVGYIIIISMFFLTMVIKYRLLQKLGGVKGVRASNSRINENSNGKH